MRVPCEASIDISPLSSTDETFKASGYLTNVVLDKAPTITGELNTPLNRAFNSDVDLFSWYEMPENRVRFRRFGMAMDVARRLSPPGTILKGSTGSTLLRKYVHN